MFHENLSSEVVFHENLSRITVLYMKTNIHVFYHISVSSS